MFIYQPPTSIILAVGASTTCTSSMWQTTDRSSTFSLLVGHDWDIDLLQSTMGVCSEQLKKILSHCCLILRGQGGWWLPPTRLAQGWQAGCDWQVGEHISWQRRQQKPMEASRGRKKGRRSGRRWASEGINTVWQAGWDKHTYMQLWERAALLSMHNTLVVLGQEERERR